jgi:hypothetical protein
VESREEEENVGDFSFDDKKGDDSPNGTVGIGVAIGVAVVGGVVVVLVVVVVVVVVKAALVLIMLLPVDDVDC